MSRTWWLHSSPRKRPSSSPKSKARSETLTFAHTLVPTVLRESISGLRRHRMHRTAATALATLRPDNYEALAYHYHEAGDPEHARRYYQQAGDRARQLAALDDAIAHYRAALDHWPEADRAGRARLLQDLGECQWVTGKLHAALETVGEARDLYRGLGDREHTAAALRVLGRLHWELADRARP